MGNKWIENNTIIKILSFHITSNKKLRRKPPWILQRAITVTGFEKTVFLKTVLRERFQLVTNCFWKLPAIWISLVESPPLCSFNILKWFVLCLLPPEVGFRIVIYSFHFATARWSYLRIFLQPIKMCDHFEFISRHRSAGDNKSALNLNSCYFSVLHTLLGRCSRWHFCSVHKDKWTD